MTLAGPVADLFARQSGIKAECRENPAIAAQTSVATSVTGPTDDPTRVRIAIEGVEGATFDIAAHPAVGATHELPCSGDVFVASLAACQEITIRMVAAAMGVTLDRLAVRVEGDWDVRGTLGVDRDVPVGFTAIRVLLDIETDAAPDRIERLLKSAERYCVVGATLHNPPELTFAATVNGEAPGTS